MWLALVMVVEAKDTEFLSHLQQSLNQEPEMDNLDQYVKETIVKEVRDCRGAHE